MWGMWMGWAGEGGAGSRSRLQSGGRRGVAGVILGGARVGGWLAGTGAGSDSLFFHQAGELCKTEEAQRGTKHQMDRVASTTKTMQTSHHGVKARLTNVRLFWFGSKSVTWLPTVYRVQFICAARTFSEEEV